MNILSLACCPGEMEITPVELAATFATTETAVQRSLGGRSVRGTQQEPVELARQAAVECLKRAGCAAKNLETIIWLGKQTDALRLQHELGATKGHVLCIAGECAEYLSAMVVADGLMRKTETKVLICTGERYPFRLADTRPTDQNYRNFLGDAGSAALLGGGRGPELIGYGFATRGADWEYLSLVNEVIDGRAPVDLLPFYGQVFRENIALARTTLEQCLKNANLTMEQVDHFCFPSIRLRQLLLPILRMLGISPEKLRGHPLYAHMGKSDVVLDLEALANGGGVSTYAIVMSLGIGTIRCIAIRL